MTSSRLALARWLLDAGAGQSSRNVLGTLRGAAANRIRLAASEARLRPGIHGLVALPDGTGAVLPLRPTPGHPRAEDPAFRDACVIALEHARQVLREPALPMLRFELEEELEVLGPSIGLPAALAFVAYFSARPVSGVVLATGELRADGRVLPVGQLDAKLAAAQQEAPDALVIHPGSVTTFADASAQVFGAAPLRADVAHAAFDAVMHRARTQSSTADGIALLESVDRAALAPADRARLLFDLGSYQRNLGHCHTAARLHTEARVLLETERQVIGAEAAERYELEGWVTDLDAYDLARVITELRARLESPFLKLRNELRCRGMLAQGLAMSGAFEEALALRRANLGIHDRSSALERVRPATLCHLALDAALGGNAAAFDEAALLLRDATRPGDETQWRFNAAVLVRGLVLLGRDALAWRWSHDEVRYLECRVPATLALAVRGTAPAVVGPEISALRAVARAARRLGRAPPSLPGGDPQELAGWLAALLELELATTEATRAAAIAKLLLHHERATRHHAGLLSAATRESELDRVWG